MHIALYLYIIYIKYLQQHEFSNIFQPASKEQNGIWEVILIYAMQRRKRLALSWLELLDVLFVFCSNTLHICTCGLISFSCWRLVISSLEVVQVLGAKCASFKKGPSAFASIGILQDVRKLHFQ